VAERMEFCLLGPLLVLRAGERIEVPRGKQRAVLAVLLLKAGRVVPVESLAGFLWGLEPPTSAEMTVRNYVKRLRQVLGESGRDRISTHPGGYSINVAADELDVAWFESLVAAAHTAVHDQSWERVSQHAEAALALWRGEPLADAGSAELVEREVPRLAELRLQVAEARLEAAVHLDGDSQAVPELRRLTREHPLREHLHALLMLALHQSGRHGEALAAYQDARRVLVAELGIEPGAELREMHQRILAADPAPSTSARAETEVRRPARPAPAGLMPTGPLATALLMVPRQLPGLAANFTGREAELAELDGMLEEADGLRPGTVVISAIGGTAGVGKTTLAVRWAHHAADRFPDGQLYVNLRGFASTASPVSPAEAIRGFLDALGVPAERIPPDLPARAGLYRGLLVGRKVLIVLDNARDEEQVRPLLPPDPGCLVIVTSRSQLTGLAAAEGARLLTLDVLTPAEAYQMLSVRLPRQRADGDTVAVAEIARLCSYLPLALAIAAARAAASPGLKLADLAAELRASDGRLDALDTGDPAVSIRRVFSSSYQALREPAQRVFRLLGLHPGPDISAAAAASLTGDGPAGTRRSLTELTRAHLLTEHRPGRYIFHDLLRAYAAELATAVDDGQVRRAAVGRILDYYLHTAYAADRVLDPKRDAQVTLAPSAPEVTPEHIADAKQALAWFTAEHQVLLAAVTLAADNAFDTCAWQLPWAMSSFLGWQGHCYEQAAAQAAAVAAAERLGNIGAQAISCMLLGNATAKSGDYQQAHACFSSALGLHQQLGDRIGEAHAHHNLAWLNERQGQYAAALSHCEEGLRLSREAGHQVWEAMALGGVGWCYALLGRYEQARAFCRQALALHQELRHPRGEASAWDSVGYAEHRLGHVAEAIGCYQHALALYREVGDRVNEAEILTHLGDAQHDAGSPSQAQATWRQALDILEDLDHPDADSIRGKLRSPELPGGSSAGPTASR
jgi:DNA-binding SARP family transcriptional activator/tetratricopeptide (TPR) repeat protein